MSVRGGPADSAAAAVDAIACGDVIRRTAEPGPAAGDTMRPNQ